MIRLHRNTLAFALVLLAACDQPGPTAPSAAPDASFTIVDAARGIITDFYWRVPTVPSNPVVSGTFDAGALSQLTIEICKLNSKQSACQGSVTARFTSSTSTRIQLDATNQEYWVNWQTSVSTSI